MSHNDALRSSLVGRIVRPEEALSMERRIVPKTTFDWLFSRADNRSENRLLLVKDMIMITAESDKLCSAKDEM
jgi:hypothetical protein